MAAKYTINWLSGEQQVFRYRYEFLLEIERRNKHQLLRLASVCVPEDDPNAIGEMLRLCDKKGIALRQIEATAMLDLPKTAKGAFTGISAGGSAGHGVFAAATVLDASNKAAAAAVDAGNLAPTGTLAWIAAHTKGTIAQILSTGDPTMIAAGIVVGLLGGTAFAIWRWPKVLKFMIDSGPESSTIRLSNLVPLCEAPTT